MGTELYEAVGRVSFSIPVVLEVSGASGLGSSCRQPPAFSSSRLVSPAASSFQTRE